MRIHLASGNAHKVAEFAALAGTGQRAGRLPLEIISARAVGGMPAVTEDAGTFVGNARKKARALRAMLPAEAWVLADDSGLCVDLLDGAPGVDSAYFAGPQGDPAANLAKLIAVLRDVPDDQRGAHFICVLLVAGPGGVEQVFEGVCGGRLLRTPRGAGGFGYDPLFVPTGYGRSLAELGDSVKNSISHRARAWRRLDEWLRSIP